MGGKPLANKNSVKAWESQNEPKISSLKRTFTQKLPFLPTTDIMICQLFKSLPKFPTRTKLSRPKFPSSHLALLPSSLHSLRTIQTSAPLHSPIKAGDIRVGNVLDLPPLARVTSVEKVKPGKGGAFATVTLQTIDQSKKKLNKRFRTDEKVEKVRSIKPLAHLPFACARSLS